MDKSRAGYIQTAINQPCQPEKQFDFNLVSFIILVSHHDERFPKISQLEEKKKPANNLITC